MSRNLGLIATCALALLFSVPGYGQDAPSLGDLARQAQKDKDKDKSNKPVAKVITNDDLPSGSAGGLATLAAGLRPAAQPASEGKPASTASTASPATASPMEQFEKLASILDAVDSLDRATLAKNVLQGSDADFPGRAKWEERLFAAKQAYVTQGRALLQKALQMEASTDSLKGIQDPNDPRVKDFSSRLQQLIQDGTRIAASFEAVMMEGRDLAGLPSAK